MDVLSNVIWKEVEFTIFGIYSNGNALIMNDAGDSHEVPMDELKEIKKTS